MQYKVNNDLILEIKDFKSYWVTKAVKLAMLSGITVKDWEAPEVPAENAIKAEEALIYSMTNITEDQLNNLRDEEYNLLLSKINEIATVPKSDSWEK